MPVAQGAATADANGMGGAGGAVDGKPQSERIKIHTERQQGSQDKGADIPRHREGYGGAVGGAGRLIREPEGLWREREYGEIDRKSRS